MIDIIAYLLPMSGDILVSELFDRNDVNLSRAVIPESFAEDCQNLIQTLDRQNIPYTIPQDLNDESFREWVDKDPYDIGVSVGYDKKLPGWLIDAPEHGTMNIHPSLLPRYRGANPYFWVLRRREQRTGVTLHYMNNEYDTGPIIRQQTVEIEPEETMGTLFFLLNRMGVDMAMEAINHLIEHNEPPDAEPQEDGDYPTAPKVTDRHLRIDWDEPFEEIEALVRAGNPFFGAYTTFRGATLRIYEMTKIEAASGDSAEPGTIQTTEDGPRVRCNSSWARLDVVQMEQLYKATGQTFQRREQKALDVLDRVI